MSLNDTSKFIALILRHKPEAIGITLDEHGWANVDELIGGIAKTRPFTMEMLEEIVSTDEKMRYSFNEDKTLIRANQGHSISVDVELEEKEPPKYLYHGTGEKYVSSIEENGLLPKSRLYVHLSSDYSTAEKVGARHGKPAVYKIRADEMFRDGYKFYLSVNGVWLTEKVPPRYFKRDNYDMNVV
jgi:putative RNA 2'-phosphotransferase